MRNFRRGVGRVWVVFLFFWIFGAIFLYKSEIGYTYRYYFDNARYAKEVALPFCQAASHFLSDSDSAPAWSSAPRVEDLPGDGSMTKFVEESNEITRQVKEDIRVCNYASDGASGVVAFEDVQLCMAKRQDARRTARQAAMQKERMERMQKQADAAVAAGKIRLEKARQFFESCSSNYKLRAPNWEWVGWVFFPPTIGVAFLLLVLFAAFRVGLWIKRGFD